MTAERGSNALLVRVMWQLFAAVGWDVGGLVLTIKNKHGVSKGRRQELLCTELGKCISVTLNSY